MLLQPRPLPDDDVLVDIHIDDDVWRAASPQRRREWRTLIDDLLAQQPLDVEQPVRLTVGPAAAGCIDVKTETPDGYPLRELKLPLDLLLVHLEPYTDVCEQLATLGEGSSSARLEALDMGKRVLHDRAAKALLEHTGTLLPDLATARSFFSLLISLHVDTTVRPSS
jgi:uncharacterized protein (UPF0262 family)